MKKESQRAMPLPTREIIDFFALSGVLAATGGFVRALKNGQGFWSSVTNSIIAGFFMLAIGVVLKQIGTPDNVIFFCSGIVGINANFILNWTYRILAAILERLQNEINPEAKPEDSEDEHR